MGQLKLLIITGFSLFFIAIQSFAGTYSGGSGTSGAPYQIATLDDLIELSSKFDDWVTGIYFIQTANIDATSTNSLNSGEGFVPIGTSSNKFQGNYDGQNNTITNLYINRPSTDYIGLFGYAKGASIQKIGLVNVNIKGKDFVGALAGISNVSSTISNSFSTGNVSGNTYVGGLVGYNYDSSTEYSYSTGNVSASSDYAGSFLGLNNAGSVLTNCYSTGNVTRTAGSNEAFGGFCGWNYNSTIINCYSTGSVNFGTVQGFVAVSTGTNTYTNNFFDQTTSGQTTGTGATATSTANMKIQSTFTSWDFSGDAETDWVMSSTISFAGYPTLRWTGGYSVAPTGTPKELATLPNLVWVAENDSRWADAYTQTANIVTWTTPSWDSNKGWTPIGNDVVKFTGSYNGGEKNISNLNINRPLTDNVGFMGYLHNATITSVGLKSVNVIGRNNVGGFVGQCSTAVNIDGCYTKGDVSGVGSIGGFVGRQSSGSITKSYSISTVTGSSGAIGGFAGFINGTVSKSFSGGNVDGVSYVGGFVGSKTGNIDNCYSTTDVTRTSGTETSIGGFCGYNVMNIVRSYSTGKVIYASATNPTDKGFVGSNSTPYTYTYNYFDQTLSSQTSGDGATAKTTVEMKTQATFTTSPSDWNFTTTIGIWSIQSGSYISYPYIQGITYDAPGASPAVNPIPGLATAESTENPTSFIATASSPAQIDLSWTLNDNSDQVLVAVNTTATFGTPTGTYSAGNNITGGGTVLYVGTNTSFDHTSLTSATHYYYKIWSKDASDDYSSGVIDDEWTLPTQATDLVFSNITSNSFNISWTRGNGDGVIVFLKKGESGTTSPVNSIDYTANASFESGSEILTGWYCVYKGTGTNVTVTNLITSSTYIAQVFEYNNNFSYIKETATGNPAITCQGEVWVDASYGSHDDFGTTHFTNLGLALAAVCEGGTVNLANVSNTTYSGDVSFDGLTVVLGDFDFELTGNITAGLIRTTNNGKLIIMGLTPGTAKTFPITDGTNDFTITINIPTATNKDIGMNIISKQVSKTLISKFVVIGGDLNLNATMTMRVDKSSIAPKTLGSSSNLRFFSTTKNRYVTFDGNKVTIEEFDDYYIITVTGVNEF